MNKGRRICKVVKKVAILLHDDPSDGVERSWIGDTKEGVIRQVFDYVAGTLEESGDEDKEALAAMYREQPPTEANWAALQSGWTGENDVYLFHIFEIEV